MFLKEHEQKSSWASKRAQRCLSFAVIFVIILVLGISSHNSWPKKAELRLDTVRPYSYGSTPEAGRPKLPFENNSIRKSTEDPFFDVIYYEDDDYEDEDDPLATAQQPIQRPEEHDEILTRDELKSREGNLIGLH
ncbi:hypothetical protein EG329_001848 [Mollisiaceae sp. DMI_Dod_QoI]|nr:hypothetical protein EG329_001848 [Helotiales sp. DMI_Dod_QoI]